MEITVNVAGVDLNTVVGEKRGQYTGEYGEYEMEHETIADLVAAQYLARALSDEAGRGLYRGLAKRVGAIRDEEIRALLTPILTEALTGPIHKTNSYGEPVAGQATTLRELIGEEARTVLAGKTDGRNFGNNVKSLRTIVRDEVTAALRAELEPIVKDEKAKVVAAVKAEAGNVIADAVKRGLSAR